MSRLYRVVRSILVLLLALSADRLQAQTLPLAYKCLGEPFSYSLRVDAQGRLTTFSLDGSVDLATTLTSTLEVEFTVSPVRRLDDGSFLIEVSITRFAERSQLPGYGSDIQVFTLGDTLVAARNDRMASVTIPRAADAFSEDGDEARGGLAGLARLLGRPARLIVSATGDVRSAPESSPGALEDMVGSAASVRFPDVPVKMNAQWKALIPVEIPGVLRGRAEASFTLERLDSEPSGRVAVIHMRSASALLGEQPVFGCGSRVRLKAWNQQVDGVTKFAVDRGRTLSQQMNMTVAARGTKLSSRGYPAGEIKLEMTVQSALELLPSEAEPIEPSP